MRKIYYLVPDLHRRNFDLLSLLRSIKDKNVKQYVKKNILVKHKPVGGIKVIYQHCLMLRALGYDAYPLIMGKYIGNFFGYKLDVKHIDDIGFNLSKNDIVVVPEVSFYLGLTFGNATKILFNQSQSWRYLDNRLKPADKGKNYLELGYDYVINCSQYLSDKLKETLQVDSHTITNGVDEAIFYPNPEMRVNKRVLVLSRKHPEKVKEIIDLSADLSFDFHVVDGLTESELIKEYQQADIFLTTGYPEGFSLPPLEAMSCGCVVVGFTGGGADEFMIHNVTALVATDGASNEVVIHLRELEHNTVLKERIRQQGIEKASGYTLENTKNMLKLFYDGIA